MNDTNGKYPDIDKVLSGESEGCIVCADCLEVMAEMPDGCVDAVMTDPPYGIGEAAGKNKLRGLLAVSKDYGDEPWDDERPCQEAFEQMLRTGKEQVMFGGNYFADLLPPSPAWIVWDKDNGETDFADVEMAWTSYRRAARKVKWRWNGMLQEPGRPKDYRQHPTQKPLGLMEWVLENYTPVGCTILDPFCGSGTTCVAARKLGRRWIGIDVSEKYCEIARERLRNTPLPRDSGLKSQLGTEPKHKTFF